MRIGIIVQARMSSSRFQGKVLYEVGGKPVLEYLLERLARCHYANEIVVATSTEDNDDAIEAFCQKKRVDCYRGPLTNVAQRFKEVLNKYQFDGFVRVSADSPLLDPWLVDKLVRIFQGHYFDLVTNVSERTFPRGQSVEVLRSGTFRKTFELMARSSWQEHVTRYYYDKPNSFKIFNVTSSENYSSLQLSVDTKEDAEKFASIVSGMTRPHWEYNLQEILKLYRREISEISVG